MFIIFQYLRALGNYFVSHKIIAAIALAVLAGGGYWAYGAYASDADEARYVLGTVQKGTIIASISAGGQVASSDETDIKAKAAGDIISLTVKAGQRVAQGQAIASIDSTSARSAVTDAELAVEEAQINLEQSTLQAPIDFKTLQQDVDRAKRDLDDTYEDMYVTLSKAFIDLPDAMTGMDDILYGEDISDTSQNLSAYQNFFISTTLGDSGQIIKTYAARAEEDYKTARTSYNAQSLAFKQLNRTATPATIETALDDVESMTRLAAQAATSEVNLIDSVVDQLKLLNRTVSSSVTSAQTSARGYLTIANSVLSSLTTAQKTLQDAKDAITDAEHDLELAAVGNTSGDNPFDLKLLQNTLKQKQAALVDAQQALADHTVRAPFAGILAAVTAKRGDSVSNGASVGTLISDQKIAELSLNEVDVAKVSVGDKATLTFDAVENLTLTGTVAEINSIGTVSQGVVSYTLKVGFDSQDERIKSGMTVNAAIQTDTKQDVLIVPSSAVKTQSGVSYVQVFNPALSQTSGTQGVVSDTAPQQIEVETGLSDDTNVEIISGIEEGQQIVTRTISGTATTNTTTSTSGSTNNRGGGGGFGGPAIRF